jgi:UBX domain-containing protein 1
VRYSAAISSPTREFTLATAYPHRVLDDNSQTLQEAGLANSVVVHKFIN